MSSANGQSPRDLPHSLEAEVGLLSSIFVDPDDVMPRALEAGLRQDRFYDKENGLIFNVLSERFRERLPIDTAIVAEELTHLEFFKDRNVFAKVVSISTAAPTTALSSHFIQKVRDLAALREVIRASSATIEEAYEIKTDIAEFIQSVEERTRWTEQFELQREAVIARGIDSFVVPPDNDPSILLGNRYLCRGDGLVLVSSSGMGKSALAIQAAIMWCFGLPFMGVLPNGKLRSLIFQSEDSDGDIAEVWASFCHKLNLTKEQREFANKNVVVVTDRINRGPKFLAELRRRVLANKFDLVWINPLAAYLAGDNTAQEVAADFLRGGLNGINYKSEFGYIIVQHTTKPATGKERYERKWYEVMYDMAGSYDIIGWARSIISLRPTDTHGEFNLVLAKRGIRAGVCKKVPQGTGYRLEATTVIPVKHSSDKMRIEGINREIPVVFWEPREEIPQEKPPERIMGRPKRNSITDFIGIFPVGAKNAIGINELLREALKIRHIAKGTFYSVINEALEKRMIVCDSSNPKLPSYYIKPSTLGDEPHDLLPDSLAGQ